MERVSLPVISGTVEIACPREGAESANEVFKALSSRASTRLRPCPRGGASWRRWAGRGLRQLA